MKKNYLLYSFGIIIGTLSLGDLINPVEKYSEFENRRLKTKVEFSKKDFLNGEFSKEYEEYINDQFIMRDTWITLKGLNEKALGKVENNGVLLGQNDYLFHKYFNIDSHRRNYNVESLKEFEKNYDGDVSFILAPNSYEIYKENLRGNPPVVNQKKEIEAIYSSLENINTVNLIEVFLNNKEKSLYYKTDHHWSLEGAYLAYREFIKSKGGEPINFMEEKIGVEDFFGTFYSKAKPINNKGDILEYIPMEGLTMEIGEEKYNGIYNFESLKTRDKYEMFLNGNNPYTKIKNQNSKNSEKILVVKDSYANSFIPFLTAHYSEIHIIDFRSYGSSFKEFLKENQFDDVLILYNFNNFCTDGNFLKIKL